MSTFAQNIPTKSLTPTSEQVPLVSIIIPNYNHGQYIRDAIDSILAQAYRNFEIIVVDDGSTDNSREIVTEYGEAVNYIWQENQGLSAARNTGLKAAQGTYIALLDADDMYEPDFLSTMVFSLLAQPEADGIICGYRFVDHLNNPLPGGEARSIPADQLYLTLLNGNFLVPESILVHRHCYEHAGPFDESLRACEDWDMWLRVTSQYKVVSTNRILTRHRILPGSMSTDPIRMLTNRMSVLGKHLGPETGDSANWPAIKRRAYGQGYLTSVIEYLQYGDKNKACQCFQQMVKADSRLLTQQDTFYELGCGDQPKGQRGNLSTLNLDRNAKVLKSLLDQLFKDKAFGYLRCQKDQIYVIAYYTLGMLAYNKADMPSCRRYLSRALRLRPDIRRVRSIVVLYLKSLLGRAGVKKLRNIMNSFTRV